MFKVGVEVTSFIESLVEMFPGCARYSKDVLHLFFSCLSEAYKIVTYASRNNMTQNSTIEKKTVFLHLNENRAQENLLISRSILKDSISR